MRSSAIFFVSVVTSVRSPTSTRRRTSFIRSSIWLRVSRTSTSGSTIPVGRTICSTIRFADARSNSPGVADTITIWPIRLEELLEAKRPVVEGRRQPEAVVDERLLAGAVALVHPAELRDRLVRLVDEDHEVLGEVVDERVRRAPLGAAVEDPRVVLDPRREPQLLEQLDVVLGSLPQAMRLEQLAALLEERDALVELVLDLGDRPLDRLLLGDVVRGRPHGHVVDLVEHLAGQRVEVLDRLDLVAEQGDPVRGLGVGRKDLEDLALHPERPAGEVGVVAAVLHADQLAEGLVAVDPIPDLEQLHLLLVELGRADAVDAGHGGDDDDVAAGEQRGRGRVAQPVDLVVDRRVLLDVEVLGRDVRLGLVVVVVADEVLDGVVREELPELVAELRREGLVVGDDERRAAASPRSSRPS